MAPAEPALGTQLSLFGFPSQRPAGSPGWAYPSGAAWCRIPLAPMDPEIRPDPARNLEEITLPARPFLPRLCEVVREELHIGTLYRPDCCIAATAILNEVLDYFQLTASPLSVIATIFNPVMSERIAQEGMPTLEEAERDWFTKGCYSLAVGAGDAQPGKWPGHLVTVLGGRVLIDLTLDQANRPQHGIVLPMQILAPCDPDFLAGQARVAGSVGGCRVVYEARPGDRSFERSNDWRSRKRRADVVGAAIRLLKKEF